VTKPAPQLPETVVAFLRQLSADRFFGTVTITFQAGKPLQVRTETVHKVDDLPEAPKETG
jgi:hypothetical protein